MCICVADSHGKFVNFLVLLFHSWNTTGFDAGLLSAIYTVTFSPMMTGEPSNRCISMGSRSIVLRCAIGNSIVNINCHTKYGFVV